MSGLTKIGKDILDFHDSGITPDLIAVVLNVSASIVRITIDAYAGTSTREDALDELVGGPTALTVTARRRRASAHS